MGEKLSNIFVVDFVNLFEAKPRSVPEPNNVGFNLQTGTTK